MAAVGLTVRDLFPPGDGPPPPRNGRPAARTFPTAAAAVAELERRYGPRSAVWAYHDAAGDPVGLVVRWDRAGGKDIRPVARHPDGWRVGAMPAPRLLYGLPGLGAANRVVVVEGEKATDAARSLGFTATTSAGGAQAAAGTDWSPLAGKDVWILPDNDAPGRGYADRAAGVLAKLGPAPTVRVVELPGLPDGGDVADWVAARGPAADPARLRAEVEAPAARPAPGGRPPAARLARVVRPAEPTSPRRCPCDTVAGVRRGVAP